MNLLLQCFGEELPSQKVSPEPRLYGQLAQCCLRDRQGRRASEAAPGTPKTVGKRKPVPQNPAVSSGFLFDP